MIEQTELQHAANWYIKRGLSVFPLRANDKRPLGEWNQYRSELATEQEIANWKTGNLGLSTGVLSRVAVIDCESRKDAEWFYDTKGKTSMIVQTRRGYHLFFRYPSSGDGIRNGAKVKDENGQARYDIRGEGGYVVAPPSVVDGWKYQFVFKKAVLDVEKLPEFRPEWCPKPVLGGFAKQYTDGVAYISRIRAVAGDAGHNATWQAVNVLKDSGMGETEALAALCEWNRTNADPPWSMGELLHKVKDCYGG